MSARFAFNCASCACRCAYCLVFAVDIEAELVVPLAWVETVLLMLLPWFAVVEIECERVEVRGWVDWDWESWWRWEGCGGIFFG